MTQESERLLKDHKRTNARKLTNLESRLDAQADLMMRKLDELLTSNNQDNRSDTSESTNGFRKSKYTESLPPPPPPPKPEANFESKERRNREVMGSANKVRLDEYSLAR